MTSCVHAAPTDTGNGWKAALSLSFEAGPERTFVRRTHKGPLSIQRPFYPEPEVAHVYLLHPPGGVVGGDELRIDVRSGEKAAGIVTTPGATKFYRTNGQASRVEQRLEVQGGSLEWFPQENIFFNGCMASLNTTIVLSEEAAFAGWDIQCYGRTAGELPFTKGAISNKLTVLSEGTPIFYDRLIVDKNFPLSQCTTFRGCTVSGTLLFNRMSAECCEPIRNILDKAPEFYVTNIDSLLVVRYLGNSAEQAKQGFCDVWSALRYRLNKRTPCVPRIWAT